MPGAHSSADVATSSDATVTTCVDPCVERTARSGILKRTNPCLNFPFLTATLMDWSVLMRHNPIFLSRKEILRWTKSKVYMFIWQFWLFVRLAQDQKRQVVETKHFKSCGFDILGCKYIHGDKSLRIHLMTYIFSFVFIFYFNKKTVTFFQFHQKTKREALASLGNSWIQMDINNDGFIQPAEFDQSLA